MRNLTLAVVLIFSAAAYSQTPDTANPYVRKPRSGAISLEMGMNSLASLVGVTGTFFVQPRVPIDLGVGLSYLGLRPGFRARYLFSPAKLSGFAYGGLKYGLGSGDKGIEFPDPDDKSNKIEVKIDASPFLDLGLGLDYLAHSGFYFTGTLGWSMLLGSKNYEWTLGTPSQDAEKLAKGIFGSGPALSLSLGYAFK